MQESFFCAYCQHSLYYRLSFIIKHLTKNNIFPRYCNNIFRSLFCFRTIANSSNKGNIGKKWHKTKNNFVHIAYNMLNTFTSQNRSILSQYKNLYTTVFH
jgi:hypothetical protein